MVFFDYGVSVGVDFTNPAHPAFYVNGIRVPFSISTTAAAGEKTLQELRIDETVPFAYFLVRSEKGVPKANLTFPDGSEHPWETTPTFGPGELPPSAMVSRRENDAIGESYFLVGRPPLGEYSLEIENAQELESSKFSSSSPMLLRKRPSSGCRRRSPGTEHHFR